MIVYILLLTMFLPSGKIKVKVVSTYASASGCAEIATKVRDDLTDLALKQNLDTNITTECIKQTVIK